MSHVTITVEDPADAFRDRLLALLVEHTLHADIDVTWTVERAVQYYRVLPARARHIACVARYPPRLRQRRSPR